MPATSGFDEVQFPVDISYGAVGGPEFNTTVVVSTAGIEQRNINWSQSRGRWDVAHGLKTQAQLDILIAFFRARQGRAIGFRFKDHVDFALDSVDTNIDNTPDGVELDYRVVKRYTSGTRTVLRNISKLVHVGDEETTAQQITIGGLGGDPARVISTDADLNANNAYYNEDTGLFDFRLTGLTANQATITNITQANPAVVTVSDNLNVTGGDSTEGVANGETLWIEGVVGMTEVNGRRFVVRNISYGASTTFELEGENSLGHTAYSSGGTAEKIPQTGETFRIDGEFDVPVRFDTDQMEVEIEFFETHNWRGIPIVELRV